MAKDQLTFEKVLQHERREQNKQKLGGDKGRQCNKKKIQTYKRRMPFFQRTNQEIRKSSWK